MTSFGMPDLPPFDDSMSVEDLRAAKVKTQEVMDAVDVKLISIRSQLSNAQSHQKETGEYADPAWWAKANAALRWTARYRQNCQAWMGLINRKIKSKNGDGRPKPDTFDSWFKHHARQVLPKDQYMEIVALANESMSKEG